jgi:transposase
MPASITAAKKARVQAKLELGMSTQTIAEEEHQPLRTIQRFATNMHRYGSIQAPRALSQGRPRTITPEMEQV